MLIKDYLDLNHFNWIEIMNNQDTYLEKQIEDINESDIEEAFIENDLTNARSVMNDHTE